jgi:hypothetical protein
MDDEQFANEMLDPQPVGVVPHMPAIAAFLVGAWYSMSFGAAMSLGVKYLHPDTPPEAHGILQSFAWALGSGIGIALATHLAKSHRMGVGIGSTLISMSIWIGFLYVLRGNWEAETDQTIWGFSISIGTFLILLTLLVFIVGVISTMTVVASHNGDELANMLLLISTVHWLWLWIAGFAWVCMIPIVVYYVWLQIAIGVYATIHPSLWGQAGLDTVFGFLGIFALLFGIEISFKSVSDKGSYGGVVWKRVLVFLAGTVLLGGVISPLLLNIQIDRLKELPASIGALHPWWVL